MASDNGFTYALIDEDGVVKSVRSQTTAWLASFARHHHLAQDRIRRGYVSTVFLGCGRTDGEDGEVKGAFETALINAEGRVIHQDTADTVAEAMRNHQAMAQL